MLLKLTFHFNNFDTEQEVDYFTIVDPDALASNTESPHKDKEVDEGTISRVRAKHGTQEL